MVKPKKTSSDLHAKSKRAFGIALDKKDVAKQVDKFENSVIKGANKFIVRRWQKLREVRSQIVVWCALIATILLAVGLQIFFSQQGYRTLTMIGGGTYREGVVGRINSLNPLYASSESEKSASQLMFSRLLSYDASGQLKNDLAKSITLSDDGLTYSVTIRDDVFWHDGEKLTADDVRFTVELMQNPLVKSTLGNAWRGIKVRQAGDYSIEFTLPVLYSPFRSALTFPILPEHILGQIDPTHMREAEFSSSPIGSGALRFQSLRTATTESAGRKQVLHLSTNQNYYASRPRFERFEIHAFSDHDDLHQAIKNSELSAGSDVRLTELKELADWEIQESSLQNAVMVFFNTDRANLKTTSVRRALRASLDLSKIRCNFNSEFGNYVALDYPILPNQLGRDRMEPKKWFNLEGASDALKSAGFVYNDGTWLDAEAQPLEFTMVVIEDSNYVRLAELLAQAWQDFGVKINLTEVDLDDSSLDFVRDILQPRNYDILVYEIDLGFDPDQFVYWHSSQRFSGGLNQSNYSNSTVDTLLATARSSRDVALRRVKYQAFINQWLEDTPAIALLRSKLNYATRVGVQSFEPSSSLVNPQVRYTEIDSFLVNRHLVYTTP